VTDGLLPQHRELIEKSAISEEVERARGYWSATERDELEALGFAPYQRRVPALVIPIRNVHGEIATYQARPDSPRMRRDNAKSPIKYESVGGRRLVLDVPVLTRPALGDPRIDLWLTEGARKVDAAVSRGLHCIGVPGVWGWRGTNTQGGKTALPDWECIALNGRRVYLAFDSDAATNRHVALALRRLAAFLASRHADVRFVLLGNAEGATHA
jgi:hypothetical protein